jgi:cell division protein FtsB
LVIRNVRDLAFGLFDQNQDLALEIDRAHRIIEERDATIAELRTKVEILKTEIATLKFEANRG